MNPELFVILKLKTESLEQKKQFDGDQFNKDAKYLVIPKIDHFRSTIPVDKSKRGVLPGYHFGTREEATVLSHNEAIKWYDHLRGIKLRSEKYPIL